MAKNRQDAAARARARKAAERAAEPTKQRSVGRIIGIGAFIVVGILLVAVVARPEPETIDGVPEGTELIDPGDPVHVEGEIAYEDDVPVGGAHNPIWLNCGVYDVPVRAENAIHSLEHGAVWITYNDTIDADGIAALERIGNRAKVIVSPVADQESPVQATSWGRRLRLDDPTDQRIEQFATEFTKVEYAPEPGARCSGGVGNPK